jgi:molybdenum cofactor biosynthesis protein A
MPSLREVQVVQVDNNHDNIHIDNSNGSGSSSNNSTNGRVSVRNGNLNSGNHKIEVKSTMPRLEQLRQKLANDKRNNNDHLSAFSSATKTAITTTSTAAATSLSPKSKKHEQEDSKQNNSSSSPSPSDDITWREVLHAAKQRYQEQQSHMILSDAFSRKHSYLRISLAERCNLRCLYCMPPEGVPLQPKDSLLNASEISRLTKLFSSEGVDKVRLTGGEPLLRKDLPEIISFISDEPNINSVGITTNGITLSRHLPTLVENGLTHANISLDTLQTDKFQEITRRKGLKQVLKAIEDASHLLPQGNVKINCVVMKGFNDNELRDFIDLGRDLPVDIRFIEWMPFNDNGWQKNRFLSYDDMMKKITQEDGNGDGVEASLKGLPPTNLMRIEDGPNDTTKWWKAPDHMGRVGFITSMTQHFCGTCNRLRVTADGQLKVCLFGSAEVSLRDAMREGASDEDLGLIVWAALQNKHFALGGHGNAEGIKKANNNRPMTLIGG